MASAARLPATLTALAAALHHPHPRAEDIARLVDALAVEPDAAALADAGAVELLVGALITFPRLSAVTRPALDALRQLRTVRPAAAAALPAPLAARFAATLATTIGDREATHALISALLFYDSRGAPELFAAGIVPVLLDVIRFTLGGISGGGGGGGGSAGGGNGGGGGGGGSSGTRFRWTSVRHFERSGANNLVGSACVLRDLCWDSPPRAAAVAAAGGAEALAAILPLCHRPPAGVVVSVLVDELLHATCSAIAESVQHYAPRARALVEAGALREVVELLGEWGGGGGGAGGGAGASSGADAVAIAYVARMIAAMALESDGSQDDDDGLFGEECARVVVIALRAYGAASAPAGGGSGGGVGGVGVGGGGSGVGGGGGVGVGGGGGGGVGVGVGGVGVGGADGGASAATIASVARAIAAMALESDGSEDDDAGLLADEGARVLVVALRAYGAASAPASRDIAGAMWHLATRVVPARRGLLRHGAPRALVAAMIAHFDVTEVVGWTSAALGAIVLGAAPPLPMGRRVVVVDGSVVGVPLPPRSGGEERGASVLRAAAAGGAAADDDDAALARA
jgi:hypothetical protein